MGLGTLKTLFITIRALLYGSGFVLLWGWIALSARRRYDPRLGIVLPEGLKAAGVLLMIPGGLLVLLCLGMFIVRGRGTGAPFDPPRVFVATGPYRYVRNPMYIGAALFLLGFALWERSISILGVGFLLLLGAHTFVLVFEEPDLERRFGESYLAYKKTVHRWVPRLPAPS